MAKGVLIPCTISCITLLHTSTWWNLRLQKGNLAQSSSERLQIFYATHATDFCQNCMVSGSDDAPGADFQGHVEGLVAQGLQVQGHPFISVRFAVFGVFEGCHTTVKYDSKLEEHDQLLLPVQQHNVRGLYIET